MAQYVKRQPGVSGRRDSHQFVNVRQVIRKLLDVEALTLGLAPPAKIQRIGGEPFRRKLFSRPFHVSAVCIEAVDENHDPTRLTPWTPGADENPHTAFALKRFLRHVCDCFVHRVSLLIKWKLATEGYFLSRCSV